MSLNNQPPTHRPPDDALVDVSVAETNAGQDLRGVPGAVVELAGSVPAVPEVLAKINACEEEKITLDRGEVRALTDQALRQAYELNRSDAIVDPEVIRRSNALTHTLAGLGNSVVGTYGGVSYKELDQDLAFSPEGSPIAEAENRLTRGSHGLSQSGVTLTPSDAVEHRHNPTPARRVKDMLGQVERANLDSAGLDIRAHNVDISEGAVAVIDASLTAKSDTGEPSFGTQVTLNRPASSSLRELATQLQPQV